MATSSTQVVNEALGLIGFDGPAVTGVSPGFDSSTAGKAAALYYVPAVTAVARMHGWDFARTVAAMVTSGNTAPFPWSYEFLYPGNCAQFLEISSPTIADPNNPVPYDKARGTSIVNGVQVSVIWANISPAVGIFTGLPVESTWDGLFEADVIRYLASQFAMSQLGKPDAANQYFEAVGALTQTGASRSDT
jgi:hypothetical protein